MRGSRLDVWTPVSLYGVSQRDVTHDLFWSAMISMTSSYLTSFPDPGISARHEVMKDESLPSRSITAPTLELRSSFISLRQLQSTASTRGNSSGNRSTRCAATGDKQDAATERTSSSRSPRLSDCQHHATRTGGRSMLTLAQLRPLRPSGPRAHPECCPDHLPTSQRSRGHCGQPPRT